ncbi:TetR/AcrR family transcriptional regulator [Pseudorhodoferax sp.]|uniref:TetR/AcrR family transcriptional regulator n=1 Tax=Pseudorhodoferax sp. TaxID=1993553 RepID=UPI0039E6972B
MPPATAAAPATTRPRTKPAVVRREELMDAAQALFLDKGFDATSVDEIVAQAGVAKGTFYFHFKTKDDVLRALRERFVVKFHERLESAVAACAPDDWSGRLEAWMEAAVDGYLDQFALHDLVFHEFRPSSRRMQHDNPITRHLATLIADGAQNGAWTAPYPRLMAAMLFGGFHGAVDEEIVAPSKTTRQRLTAEVLRFCRMALGLACS